MNTIQAKVNKIILALTSVGIVILLMLPASLSASHYRYGTMSWDIDSDNGTHVTIRLKMESGWRSVGTVNINWGDGSSEAVATKTIYSGSYYIKEIGVLSGSEWTTGVTHTYPKNGTTEYLVYWGSQARIAGIENGLSNKSWRAETKVNIGGTYDGNVSPVSAVPPIVKVQDNTTDNFMYQVVATDANGDNLSYRWGTWAEFVGGSGIYAKPTGMTLSSAGLIEWDVQDSVLSSSAGDLWSTFVMVHDLDSSGDNKSHIPIDFFFEIASASNDPPVFTKFPTGTRTVSVGNTKTIKIKSTDDSGVAPTITVLNPPSDNSSIWDNTTSTSGGETTFIISFTPDSSMDNATYAVNIRSTDNASMTKDQSLGLYVSTVSNADPTAPTLVSPADNSTVTEPVTFQWEKSTDPDNDAVSHNIYICTDSGFVGCSGTSVTAGVNFVPPFNQNFHDNLIPWPSPLHAATVSQQISQDPSMIPKWVIMLGVLGLLSGFISLSVKNITHRRIVFMFIFLTFCFSLTIISCGEKDEYGESWEKKGYTPPDLTNTTSDNLTYTTSDLTTNTTYYWKVIASDTRGGSAESETWSFTVQ